LREHFWCSELQGMERIRVTRFSFLHNSKITYEPEFYDLQKNVKKENM